MWLYFVATPLAGLLFVRLVAHCLESRRRTEGADFGSTLELLSPPLQSRGTPLLFRNEPSMVKAVRYAAASVPGDMDTVLDTGCEALLRNFIHSLEAVHRLQISFSLVARVSTFKIS